MTDKMNYLDRLTMACGPSAMIFVAGDMMRRDTHPLAIAWDVAIAGIALVLMVRQFWLGDKLLR